MGRVKFFQYLNDIIFPSQCVFCGKNWSGGEYHFRFVCTECMENFVESKSIVCPTCGAILPGEELIEESYCICCKKVPLKGFVSLFHYNPRHPLREYILALKHRGQFWVAPDLSHMLAKKIRRFFPDIRWDGIVSVPLHFTRKWYRGFNQAALIAEYLSKELKIPYYSWLLNRTRRTKPQSGGRQERLMNVKGAFASGGICKHAKLLLLDDVVTTGATIQECADILYRSGADEIWIVSCAWVSAVK